MKVKLGSIPFVYPVPIILAGTMVGGTANFATLGDCGIMGIRPPLVYISTHSDHHTTKGVLEHKTFSINIPSTDMLAVTDYCGIISGRDVDKSQLFEIFYGDLKTAPMIKDCPVNLECRVVKEFSIQHREVFVGEVLQAFVDEDYTVERDGRRVITDAGQLSPIMYALDNQYYTIGPAIGTGYKEGRAFTPESGEIA